MELSGTYTWYVLNWFNDNTYNGDVKISNLGFTKEGVLPEISFRQDVWDETQLVYYKQETENLKVLGSWYNKGNFSENVILSGAGAGMGDSGMNVYVFPADTKAEAVELANKATANVFSFGEITAKFNNNVFTEELYNDIVSIKAKSLTQEYEITDKAVIYDIYMLLASMELQEKEEVSHGGITFGGEFSFYLCTEKEEMLVYAYIDSLTFMKERYVLDEGRMTQIVDIFRDVVSEDM